MAPTMVSTVASKSLTKKKAFIPKNASLPKNVSLPSLTKAYSSQLPISAEKKNDLLSLCKELTIPKEFHTYHTTLKSNSAVRDCLAEPDFDEENEIEDKDEV